MATTFLMSNDSVPQPDLALKILPEYGGQSRIEGKYPAGAPELIVEVSNTTASKDGGEKLLLYERSGVCKYLIVRPRKEQISWRRLVDGKYQRVELTLLDIGNPVFPRVCGSLPQPFGEATFRV
jgi:Uma2 family endonuclease